jgi:hypothetical protein
MRFTSESDNDRHRKRARRKRIGRALRITVPDHPLWPSVLFEDGEASEDNEDFEESYEPRAESSSDKERKIR